MAELWKHVIFVLPLVVQGLAQLCISNSSSETPEELCTLASPRLTFTKDGVTVNAGLNELQIPEGVKVWVGYVQILQPFFYEGCVSKQYLENISSHEIDANPGECYSYCQGNTSYIGLSELKCQCLDGKPDQHDMLIKQGCTSDCESQNDVLCGESEYVSVYKPGNVTDAVDEHKESKRCLAVVPKSKQKSWLACTEDKRYMCKKANSDVRIRGNKKKPWGEIMQLCAEENNLPVQAQPWYSRISEDYDNTVWSGHIRSSHVLKFEDRDSSIRGNRGYITNSSGLLKLAFTSDLRDWKSLCICATTTSVGTSTPHTTTLPVPSSPPSSPTVTTTSIGTHTTTESSNPPSSPTDSPTTTPTETTTEDAGGVSQKQNGGSLVAVFVVVPLVALLAIVAVIVFVCWRLRRKRPKDKDTIDIYGDKNSKVGRNNGAINASYQDKDGIVKSQSTDEIRHDYLTLEPVSEYEVLPDAETDAHTDKYYDTSGSVNKSDGRYDTGNVYNRLDDVTDDTYNQTNASSFRQDDTYNHIGNSGPDNTYNTTETLSNSKKTMHTNTSGNNMTGQVDDTYNHIGNNSNNVYNTTATLSNSTPGTRTTDNDYSKVNKRDDTYSHLDGTEQTLEANDDIDDTYNHINKEMGDKSQVAAEYTYTKPIPKKPMPTPGQQKPPYDYATATPKGAGGTSQKPAMFSFDALPNDGSYELAKERQQTLNYELAKPPGK